MIFKSVKRILIAMFRFLSPVVLAGCLFINTIDAQTPPKNQPGIEAQNKPSSENRRLHQDPLFWQDQKGCITGILCLVAILLLLIVGLLVQKRRGRKAENLLREISRTLEQERSEKERLVIETQLQQASQKEAIAVFSSGMIHDINNILSSVLGFAELAKIGLGSGAAVEKDLDEALKAAKKARDLIGQIEPFMRQVGIRTMPIAVVPFIKGARKLIRALLPASIEIRFHSGSFKGEISADPVQFHQILLILCVNASHAMKKKSGLLEIRLQDVGRDDKVLQSDLKPGRYLLLSIGDAGEGMPEETIARIFDPLRRSVCTAGSFPGLSLVQDFAGQMGGAISVRDESETGIIFHVLFPKYEKESDEESNGSIINY